MIENINYLIKPTSADCNLNCTYCFYLEKSELYPEQKVHRMSEEVLEAIIKKTSDVTIKNAILGWQGGEPTLMGLPFFEKAISLINKYSKPNLNYLQSIQTNGVLIDKDWCKFLNKNKILVGLSVDGAKEDHNHYRKDKGGNGAFSKVINAAELFNKHHVDYNILTVLNGLNSKNPQKVLEELNKISSNWHQFIPIYETDNNGNAMEFNVSAKQYGNFLKVAFDDWSKSFPPKVHVRYFDDLFNFMIAGAPQSCTFRQKCGDYLVIEHNGDVYPCDFYVDKDLKLGNILTDSPEDMLNSPKMKEFANKKLDLSDKCKACPYLKLCWNECPKNRVGNKNVFCSAYLEFFEYAVPKLQEMIKKVQSTNFNTNTKPNDPCPCGSTKKYKKCCG